MDDKTKRESCNECKFLGESEERGMLPFCRRFPPTVAMVDEGSVFPSVTYSTWCGEFSRKIEEGKRHG